MELKQINESSVEFARVAEIYEEAFPPEERVPMSMLYTPQLGIECDLFALQDEGETVGLVTVALLPYNILYVWYFAIDKDKRGHDYGSKALVAIKEHFPGRYIMGVVEKPDESAPNNEQRLRRIRFYERAGYVLTGESITLRGVEYMVTAQKGAPSELLIPFLNKAAELENR